MSHTQADRRSEPELRAFAENENACAVCRGNVALRVASTPLVTEEE